MQNQFKKRDRARKARMLRVRSKVRGNSARPRMSVFKSNQHLYVQLIDDEKGLTLAGIGTQSEENAKTEHNRKSKDAARHLGKQIAELAKKQSIEAVIFDRGRYKFHGVIAELAAAARDAGLKF